MYWSVDSSIGRSISGTALGVILLVVSGCAGSQAVQRSPKPVSIAAAPEAGHSSPLPAVWGVTSEAASADERIRNEVEGWLGTPHRMGGTTHNGVDCSAFVRAVYRDVFQIELPRTTTEQARTGTEISPDELQPGDLVFFHPSKSNHVGIYLSNGEFAHASESRGVTISKFDQPYWNRAYWTARRVLQDTAASPAEVPVAQPEPVVSTITPPHQHVEAESQPQTDSGPRAGW